MTREVETKIYVVRNQRVMLDSDLASLYQVTTKQLNQAVKRNLERFPGDFMFILTNQEVTNLKSQFVTSSFDKNTHGGRRKLPLCFTEHGVAMLSSVLTSPRAIAVNIAIIRAFIRLRSVRIPYESIENRIQKLESKYDHQFKVVFDAIRKIMKEPDAQPRRKIGIDMEHE